MAVPYNLQSVGVDADRDLQAWVLRDRVYRLKVTAGEFSYEIGNVDGAGEFPVHINFRVERTDGTALNLASIRLWNISKELQNMLLQEGAHVELRAGYGDPTSIPVIFEGTVVRMYPELSRADRVYNVECVDGFQELADTYVSMAFVPGSTFYDVLTGIARSIGIPLVISRGAERVAKQHRFNDGISFYGRASGVLSSVIADGYSWRVEGGVLYVSLELEPSEASFAYVLTPNTGLIGMPMKLFESSVTQNEGLEGGMRYSIYGYRVQFFMNGALKIKDNVYLESREVSGPFTIFKMTITGDNLSSDWVCSADLKEYAPK